MWTLHAKKTPSIKYPVPGVCVNLNLELGKTSTDEYVRKLGGKHIARETEVEIRVDLGLVRNDSDHPTKDGSSLNRLAIKRRLFQTSAPSKAPSGYILLTLLVKNVSKREYI